MELKLNVYKSGKVIKTYRANDFTLTTGLCEDVLNLVDIDKITSYIGNDEQKLGFEIIKIVGKLFPKFKPFLQDIFVGLTDEEFKQTSIKEVGQIIIQIIKYTVSELYSVETTKN